MKKLWRVEILFEVSYNSVVTEIYLNLTAALQELLIQLQKFPTRFKLTRVHSVSQSELSILDYINLPIVRRYLKTDFVPRSQRHIPFHIVFGVG